MTSKSAFLDPAVAEYLSVQVAAPDEVLADLARYNAGLGPISSMQIAPEQGVFLTLLTKLLAPRLVVEIGTFTGYSAICFARGLPEGARLLCCDVSAQWTTVARGYWERAEVAGSIELRLAPALETLRALPARPHIDLAFLDADKGGYLAYWNELVPRLRPGGVILVDNVLWSGAVVDPARQDADTRALREFNEAVRADDRVEQVMLPLADGLTLARRVDPRDR